MKITELVKAPDFATILNAISGFLAILLCVSGNLSLAPILILLSSLFDYFDGKIARLINRKGTFGKELDSLADTISFIIAPAVLGFSHGINSLIGLLSLAFFVTAGILRLARYNVTEIKGFEGLPTTVSGMIIASLYLIGIQNEFVFTALFFILGFLMISRIKIKRVLE